MVLFRTDAHGWNIYAKHWIEDIVWEMNTDEEDTTSEVRSSSKDKRNKGFIAHIDKLRSYLDAPEEIHLGRKPDDLLETGFAGNMHLSLKWKKHSQSNIACKGICQ